MSEHPKYIAMHGIGVKGIVLERCDNDTCYSKYAEVDNILRARHLADQLNKAESKPK